MNHLNAGKTEQQQQQANSVQIILGCKGWNVEHLEDNDGQQKSNHIDLFGVIFNKFLSTSCELVID